MSDKPKPCPFCGDTEPFPTHCDPNCCDSVRWYECKCGAMASNEVTWNTRPLEDAKDAEIAKELAKLREENQRLLVVLEEKSRQLRRECRINDGLHSQLRNCNKAKIEVLREVRNEILKASTDIRTTDKSRMGYEKAMEIISDTIKQLEDKK